MVPFSQELNELQEEVKPLWKMPSCPRDFKRTSVEILFREAEFRLDWCSFRLVSWLMQAVCARNCTAAIIDAIFRSNKSMILLLPTKIQTIYFMLYNLQCQQHSFVYDLSFNYAIVM